MREAAVGADREHILGYARAGAGIAGSCAEPRAIEVWQPVCIGLAGAPLGIEVVADDGNLVAVRDPQLVSVGRQCCLL